MEPTELKRAISAYAEGLDLAGASDIAQPMLLVAGFLAEHPPLPDGGRCSQREPSRASAVDAHLVAVATRVVQHLRIVERVLRSGGAASSANDLALLIKSLRPDSVYFGQMLEFLKKALLAGSPLEVAEFARRLRSEVGSEAFEHTLVELDSSGLKREYVVEIARAVYGAIPKNTSRKAALKFIRKPHDAYMSAKRGIEATGGRSAA